MRIDFDSQGDGGDGASSVPDFPNVMEDEVSVFARFWDLGYQPNTFKDGKYARKLALVWETNTTIASGGLAGKPYQGWQWMWVSSNSDSNFIKTFTALNGGRRLRGEVELTEFVRQYIGKCAVICWNKNAAGRLQPNYDKNAKRLDVYVCPPEDFVPVRDDHTKPSEAMQRIIAQGVSAEEAELRNDEIRRQLNAPAPRTADAIRPEGVAPHDGSEPAPWD